MINSYPWCIIFIINTWTLKSVLPDCVWLRDKHRVLIRHRFQWTRKALGGWWRVTTWQLWLSYITCYLWRWLLPYTYNRICKGTILSNDRHLEHTHTHTFGVLGLYPELGRCEMKIKGPFVSHWFWPRSPAYRPFILPRQSLFFGKHPHALD